MTPHKFWDGLLPLRTTIQCTECCIESHHITGNLPRVHTGKDLEKRDKMGYTVLYKDDKANCVEDVEDVEDVEANMLIGTAQDAPDFHRAFSTAKPEALAPKPLLARKQRLLHLEAETKLTVPMSVESNAWREKVWTGTVWNRHQLLQISANASDFNSRLGLFWTFFPQDAVEKYGKHETGQKATWHGLSRAAVADDVGLKLKLASSLKQIKSTLRAKAGSGGGKCKAELSEHWRKQQTQAPDFPICLPCHMH